MAIVPHPGTQPAHEGASEEYAAHHPTDRPEDWGWHGEWGKYRRIAGLVCAVILVLMNTATHYNEAGAVALYSFAGAIVVGLAWDYHQRRTAWRK